MFRAVRGAMIKSVSRPGAATYFPPAGKVSKGAVKGKPFRLGFPLTIPFLNDQEGLTTPLDSP